MIGLTTQSYAGSQTNSGQYSVVIEKVFPDLSADATFPLSNMMTNTISSDLQWLAVEAGAIPK